MAAAILAFNNRCDAATLSGANWDTVYPLTNLALSSLDLQARTSVGTLANRLRGALANAYPCRMLGIAGHNLTTTARVRLRFGMAPVDIDFTSGVLDERVTYGGGANGYCFNESGVYVAASAGRLNHDPGVLNNGVLWSHSFTTPSTWFGLFGCAVLDAQTLAMSASAQIAQFSRIVMPSRTYNLSVECQLVSGNGDFKLKLYDGTTDLLTATTFTATTDWTRVDADVVTAAGVGANQGNFSIVKYTGQGVIRFRAMQYTEGTGVSLRAANQGRLPMYPTGANVRYRRIGLMREPSRTQLVTATNNITSGVGLWGRGTNLTANGFVGTWFGHNVYSFTTTAATNSFIGQSVAVAASTSYEFQFLCNVNCSGKAFIRFSNGSGGSITTTYFGTPTLISPGIYLHTLVAVSTAAQSIVEFYPGLTDQGGNQTFYLSCPMVAAGTEVTSFIPNTSTTTPLTRTTDTAVLTGVTGFPANSRVGTIFTETIAPFQSATAATASVVLGNSGVESVALRIYCTGAGGKGDVIVHDNSVNNWDSNDASLSSNVVSRQAVSFVSAADWYFYSNGSQVASNSSIGSPDAMPSVLDLANNGGLTSHLRRVTLWAQTLSLAQLASITSLTGTGASEVEYDSFWKPALEFGFNADTPADWGDKGYDVIAVASASVISKYFTVDVEDPMSTDNYIRFSRPFIGDGFTPRINYNWGAQYSRKELSEITRSSRGRKYSTDYPRLKECNMKFDTMSLKERDLVLEMQDHTGLTKEVYLVPDPADLAQSQRLGGLGTLEEMGPLDAPYYANYGTSFKWQQKV